MVCAVVFSGPQLDYAKRTHTTIPIFAALLAKRNQSVLPVLEALAETIGRFWVFLAENESKMTFLSFWVKNMTPPTG